MSFSPCSLVFPIFPSLVLSVGFPLFSVFPFLSFFHYFHSLSPPPFPTLLPSCFLFVFRTQEGALAWGTWDSHKSRFWKGAISFSLLTQTARSWKPSQHLLARKPDMDACGAGARVHLWSSPMVPDPGWDWEPPAGERPTGRGPRGRESPGGMVGTRPKSFFYFLIPTPVTKKKKNPFQAERRKWQVSQALAF